MQETYINSLLPCVILMV